MQTNPAVEQNKNNPPGGIFLRKIPHTSACSVFAHRLTQRRRGVARNLLRAGGKPGGLEDERPHRSPGAEYGNPREHQRGRDKKLTYGDGGRHAPKPPLATPLQRGRCVGKFLTVDDVCGRLDAHLARLTPHLSDCRLVEHFTTTSDY